MKLDELLDAARQGVSEAQYVAAQCYENGWGVTPDKSIAESWLLKSAKQGNAASQYELAVLLHSKGDHLVTDATSLLRDSAAQGYSPAQYLYSLYCESGIGMPANPLEAFRSCLHAAENGYSPAAWRVASMLEQGIGTDKDVEAAFGWYRRAADLGDADAAARIGLMYAKGLGIEKNEEKALEWLVEGRKRGSPWSYYRLSSVYRYGELGQPVDVAKADALAEEAEKLLKQRADHGSSRKAN